jgi:hypothetical protein
MKRIPARKFFWWSVLVLLLGGMLDGANLIVARDAEAMAGVSRGRPTGFYGH